jgi:hypothetical protein
MDFEEFGHKMMMETRDELATRDICALHLHSSNDDIQPKISHLNSLITQLKTRAAALCSSLYDRPDPVSDIAMVALTAAIITLAVFSAVVCVASATSHTITLHLFGFSLPLAEYHQALLPALDQPCVFQVRQILR